MHSSCARLRKMWLGLEKCFGSHCQVGEQVVGLGQPEVAQEVRLNGDDDLKLGGVCRVVTLHEVAGCVR